MPKFKFRMANSIIKFSELVKLQPVLEKILNIDYLICFGDSYKLFKLWVEIDNIVQYSCRRISNVIPNFDTLNFEDKELYENEMNKIYQSDIEIDIPDIQLLEILNLKDLSEEDCDILKQFFEKKK